MDHFLSKEPPHADVHKAVAADLLAIANSESESPLSIAETMHGSSWLAAGAKALVACVGSVQALEALDAEPHLLESFSADGLDPDDAALACELADVIGQARLALDPEMTTIIHRMVRRLADHADKPLRRRVAIERIAAAVVWLGFQASEMVGRHRGARSGSMIWFAFDTSSASDIGRSLGNALQSSSPSEMSAESLGMSSPPMVTDPALLHSRYRRSLVQRRDALNQLILDQSQSQQDGHPIQIVSGGGVRFATSPTTVRWAARSPDEDGRDTIMIATGDLRDMQLMSISVPDARRLIAALDQALNAPIAKAS